MAGKIAKMEKRIQRLECVALGAGFLLQKLQASYGDDFGIGMTEQVNDCIRDVKQIANDVAHRECNAARAAAKGSDGLL